MGKKKPAPLAFCFGDPEPVLSGAVYEYLGVWLLDNGRYYATPVPWSGLARLLRANAYHGPILEFKTNMAMRGFRASAALTRRDMHAVATDYMVFANAYLLLSRNWLGECSPHTISTPADSAHSAKSAGMRSKERSSSRTRAPSLCSSLAAATPETPAPTTTARSPGFTAGAGFVNISFAAFIMTPE